MVPKGPHQHGAGVQDFTCNHGSGDGQAFLFIIGNPVLLFTEKYISLYHAAGSCQESPMGSEEGEGYASFHAFTEEGRTGSFMGKIKNAFQVDQWYLCCFFLSFPGCYISIFLREIEVVGCDKEGIQQFSHRFSPSFSACFR